MAVLPVVYIGPGVAWRGCAEAVRLRIGSQASNWRLRRPRGVLFGPGAGVLLLQLRPARPPGAVMLLGWRNP